MMFKLFGYKINLEIWKNTDDEIVVIGGELPETKNFWQEIGRSPNPSIWNKFKIGKLSNKRYLMVLKK